MKENDNTTGRAGTAQEAGRAGTPRLGCTVRASREAGTAEVSRFGCTSGASGEAGTAGTAQLGGTYGTEEVADIVVIGGGAAGMMAALTAKKARKDLSVVILEKMPRPGRKILVTGKGRCNLTNACDWDEFSLHIHPKPNLLKHAFRAFTPSDTIAAFNAMGLDCVTERGRRVFPASMKAMDVVDTLAGSLKRSGVEIRCGLKVEKIEKTPEGFFRIFYTMACRRSDSPKRGNGCDSQGGNNCGIQGGNGIPKHSMITAKAVILATGGLSYPGTGSEGDGYPMATALGHKIVPCFPSLTALRPAGYATSRKLLEGIHLKNVSLYLFINGSLAQEEFGELDFTDGGIEGALGFRVSRKAVKALANGASVTVRIDLKPALDENQLEKKLGNVGMLDFSKSHTASSIPVSILSSLIPTSIAKAFAATNKANIKRYGLAASLKKWDFAIEGYTGYERAVITAGGISDDEVNPKTMESKLVPGLYFAGEILDIDGDTGGYNLQIAWSTGHAAGLAAELAAGK